MAPAVAAQHHLRIYDPFAPAAAQSVKAKAKAADKPKAKGNKDKWLQLLRGYEGFSCCEADKKGKVITTLVG